MSVKKRTLYLGWDGAYVLSRRPLRKLNAGDNGCFLSPTGKDARCIDVDGAQGAFVFGGLKLAMFEVVKLEIVVTRKKRKAAA